MRRQVIRLMFPEITTWLIDREHSFEGYEGGWHEAQSIMLICPKCWLRWAVLDFTDAQLIWPRAQTCENCRVASAWMPVPGSILIEEGWGIIDSSLLATLPSELVEREFHLHLKAYDDGNQDNSQTQGTQTLPHEAELGGLPHPAG